MKITASPSWTAANVVTSVRICMVPVWLFLAETQHDATGAALSVSALLTTVVFVLLSLTDSVDGYLARSRGEVTTLGKFLDPIADKLVVVTGLIFLVEKGLVPAWMLVVIIGREFLVSALRMLVASDGVVVAASNLGKIKTATTMVAIVGLLLSLALPFGGFASFVRSTSTLVLWIALAFTIWSGVDYFMQSKGALLDA